MSQIQKEDASYSTSMFGNTNVKFRRKIKAKASDYSLFSSVLEKVSDRLHIQAGLTPFPIEEKDGVRQCR
jgi:hypothetical protein